MAKEVSTARNEPRPAPFSSLTEFGGQLRRLPRPDREAEAAARERNSRLTKPDGSLGRLEELAVWYASWRRHADPLRAVPQILIFAGNHGVARRGVSAFPADVTARMAANFNAGGAAINQLAEAAAARLDVIPLDLDRPTSDLTEGPAMTEAECVDALAAGWRAVDPDAELLVAGEMGIGNTTSAAAVCLALYGGRAGDWTGRGTGVRGAALRRKRAAVGAALAANGPFTAGSGLEILRCLGGRELAATAGSLVRARLLRIPVLLDGFVCCAAAACLQSLSPDALDHAAAGHLSAESAHASLLKRMGKPPILDIGMRLGEGSGAAVAFHVLKCALACHSGMATFAEAGISGE